MTDVTLPSEVVPHGHGEGPGEHSLAHNTTTGISHAKLGMWIFLASDCLLFGALISTYLLYNGRAVTGPRPSDMYNIPFTSVETFVLLTSSLTMVLAVSAAQRGDAHRLRLWLLTTAALGGSFLSAEVYEFTSYRAAGLGYTTNIFGSAFYTLIGTHGTHVTFGVIMLLVLVGMSLRGKLGVAKAEAVEIIGLYWHFVDIVWIIIFTVVYLIHK